MTLACSGFRACFSVITRTDQQVAETPPEAGRCPLEPGTEEERPAIEARRQSFAVEVAEFRRTF